MRALRWPWWLFLGVLLAVGVWIRGHGLGDYYFSPDDLLHLEIASGDNLGQVWRQSAHQLHPPLIYFLLHAALQFSADFFFLRFLPLVPGALLILTSYLLGRRVLGNLGGLSMAALATFGFGPIILSEVIRPYCLLTALLTVGLWCFAAAGQPVRRASRWGYFVAMGLAALLHYSAALMLVATTMVWLATESGWRTRLRIALLHAPIYLGLCAFFFLHVLRQEGLYSNARASYLEPFFPRTLAGFAGNTRDLMEFLYFPGTALWLGGLAAVGVVHLYLSSRRRLLAVLLVTLLLNVLLTALDKYPYGGFRHSLFLFPLVSLCVAAGIQGLADLLCSGRRRLAGQEGPVHLALAVGLVAACGPLLQHYRQTDQLRRHPHAEAYATMELPLRREHHDAVLDYLREHSRPRDVVLANRQTAHYFRYAIGYQQGEYLTHQSRDLMLLEWEGLRVYLAPQFLFLDTPKALLGALQKLSDEVDLEKVRVVWLPNLGWNNPTAQIELKKADGTTYDLLQQGIRLRSATVHGAPGRLIPGALAKLNR